MPVLTLAASVGLHGITKRWGGPPVLDGVSVEVAAGSFCVLLGPSGCGKTTLLRILAGLDAADAGRITIAGRDVTALPPAARNLAMVFQSYALFPHLSAAENIVFGLRARRVPAPERARRLERAAALLGLAPFLARKPGQLSGGQQQRVALGRAIVAQAPVCLMDEPLSNLDAQLRAEMRQEIHALQRRLGITMLYVTHDQTEAMSMADQVVLLRAGHKEADAAPGALYAAPPTTFAAGFIGTPPMNLLPVRDGRMCGVPLAGALLATAATAGLRPESLSLSAAGLPAPTALPATVRRAEFLGAETVLDCLVGDTRILARLPGRAMEPPGAQLHLGFDPADLHLFGADGRRLSPAPTPTPEQAAA